jgi:hypothetical protein
MRKNFYKLSAVLLLLSVTLSIFAASTPAANDGKWYYVKSQRFNTGGPWWTFDTKVIPGAFTKADNQKFTLVSVGETDKVTIKEFGGTLMAIKGAFNATGPATGWTITSNIVNGIQGYAFPGEEQGLHQGAGSWDWEVRAGGWYDLTDFCTFFFYEVSADAELNIAIDEATERLNTATIGSRGGQTPQTAYDNYLAAINTAKTTLGSTDAGAIATAIENLNTATATFISAKVTFVQSSTSATPIWYLIKTAGRGGLGATLYTNGSNAQMRWNSTDKNVAADGTSTGDAAPALKYLFRFELQSDKSYRIVNASLPNGEVLQAAAGGYSSNEIKYGTPSNPTSTWNLIALGYNTTLNIDEIKFKSTGNGTVFHAADGNTMVSYDGGAGSASAWYVEQYTGNVSSLYKPELEAKIAAAQTLLTNTTEGTTFGQYSATERTALTQAIATAQAIYDEAASTETETAIIDLNNAIDSYKATINTNKTSLLSANANNYKWYSIRSTSTATYAMGKVISSTGRLENEKFTFENVSDPVADTQLFRFELSGENVAIINKANGFYIAANGAISATSTAFPLILLSDGYSFNIGSGGNALHAQATGSHMVTYQGSAGSASAWAFDFVKEETKISTGTNHNLMQQTYIIRTTNKVITVDGVENFDIFSISGQKQNKTQALESGIYIVRIQNQAFKVNVK